MSLPVKITALETDVPPLRAGQAEVWEFLRAMPGIPAPVLKWYEKFLLDKGIETRHFGLDRLPQVFEESADEAIRRFEQVAVRIGTNALRRALDSAGLPAAELDGIVITTCTGYLCPGLSSYIAQEIQARPDFFCMDLTGIGCGAAIPALRAAGQFLSSRPGSNVAVICVEVCSAAIYWGEEIDLILSNSIFADGAACAILTNRPHAPGPRIDSFDAVLWPEYRDDLRFKHRDARLCNVISRKVPVIAARAVDELMTAMDARHGNEWHHAAVHTGGRRVLDEIEARIPALKERLEVSRNVLRRFGNMSSPSVLFVLKEMINRGIPEEGERIRLFAFGAGFTAFGASVVYEPMKTKPVSCQEEVPCVGSL